MTVYIRKICCSEVLFFLPSFLFFSCIFQLTTAWKKIDPFRRVPANKVEIEEKPESPSEKEQIKGRLLWVKKLEIDVKFARKGIPSDKVYISVNVILRNKRYIYRIKHLDLTYCLKVLNDISETVKVLKGV